MEDIKKIPVTFILSTGRTGTQFFAKYLTQTCNNVLCLHEPPPSRRFKWYSNYYLTNRLSPEFVAGEFLKTRRKILTNFSEKEYIESSNMIFGCMKPIASEMETVKVIHIIRHPLTYIRSHLNKGFWSGIKRFTARNIPGWVEFVDNDIRKSNDPVLILAARWMYVNRVIENYQKDFPYLNFRFEDLFVKPGEKSLQSLNQIRNFVGCDNLKDEENLEWLAKPSNQSKTNIAEKWPVQQKHLDYLKQHGSDLLVKYDYNF
jgi:hypothetical protein